MDSTLSSVQGTFTVAPGASSFLALLEQGLAYFRQDRHVEAISCFTLARERLSPVQGHIAAVLDAFIASYDNYRQAQLAFHQASRRFVEAEDRHHAMSSSIQNLLLTSHETLLASPPSSSRAGEINGHQQTFTPSRADPLAGNDHRPPASMHLHVSSEVGEHRDGKDTLPALYIRCFRQFEVRRLGQPVILCQNRNGQAILRYLVAQPGFRASIDALMDILWPRDDLVVARHKVQIAVSALRRSLNGGYISDPGGGYIFCKNGVYFPNPAISISTDVDEFLHLYQSGRQSSGNEAMLSSYEKACHLYRGPFMAEDLYADWTFVRRDQLSQKFVSMCHTLIAYYLSAGRHEDAIQWANALLEENRCDEEAYRQLMQAYMAGGQRGEALRQFRRCEEVLHHELGTTPMPETITLLQSIALGQSDSSLENGNRAKVERK